MQSRRRRNRVKLPLGVMWGKSVVLIWEQYAPPSVPMQPAGGYVAGAGALARGRGAEGSKRAWPEAGSTLGRSPRPPRCGGADGGTRGARRHAHGGAGHD